MLRNMTPNRLFTQENENVEWKRDLPRPDELAKEMVAFANSDGGSILLGIDDAGNVVGISSVDEEHIINISRNNCVPPVKMKVKRFEKDEKQLIEIKVPRGENPPYSNNHRYLIRVGNTVRDASIEELLRLIVRGDHRGSILLLTHLETLRKNIRSGIHLRSKNGYEIAIQKIIELCELISETHDPSALEEAFDVLLEVSREAAMNSSELSLRIIQEMDTIALVIEFGREFYEKVKAKNIANVVFEILDDIEEYRPKSVDDVNAAFSLLHRIGEASVKANDYETAEEILDSVKYIKKGKLVAHSKRFAEFLQGLIVKNNSNNTEA